MLMILKQRKIKFKPGIEHKDYKEDFETLQPHHPNSLPMPSNQWENSVFWPSPSLNLSLKCYSL